MTWIIALLTLGLFVYLVYALIKPEKLNFKWDTAWRI